MLNSELTTVLIGLIFDVLNEPIIFKVEFSTIFIKDVFSYEL